MRRTLAGMAILLMATAAARADLQVSNLFSDGMVLQRGIPDPIWGTGEPGEKVTVKLGDNQATADTGPDGKWMVKLPAAPLNATPQDLTISGKNTITIKNVVIGDVWVCSGQSNMEWSLGGCDAPADIASADLPLIRRIKFDHRASALPGHEVPQRWQVCTPATAPGFTAVGLYFARTVQKESGVPIGLIDDNWGGTRIEPWVPPVGFEGEPPLAGITTDIKNREQNYRAELAKNMAAMERWTIETKKALETNNPVLPAPPPVPNFPYNEAMPTALYNGMIHPLLPYAIKGALWYQGESNGGEGEEYYHKMRALVGGWRKVWGEGDFPFYFVQLANFERPHDSPPGGEGWSRLRAAQLKAVQNIPNTGMAVIIDIGEEKDIHPKNKADVGDRLARWSLRNDYGKSDMVPSGPLYKSMKVEDNKIRLTFDWVGGGLMVGKKEGRKPTEEVKDGKLARFAIAGEDKNWVWADAVIDGNTVVVSSPNVAKPVAVRYAYSMNPVGANFYNKEGLPASPFRTDEW